jgi:hypothetical protein
VAQTVDLQSFPDQLFSLPTSTCGEHFPPDIADQALAELES